MVYTICKYQCFNTKIGYDNLERTGACKWHPSRNIPSRLGDAHMRKLADRASFTNILNFSLGHKYVFTYIGLCAM